MGVADAVEDGRRMAESLMVDTGRAYRPTGRAVQNSDGEEEPEFEVVFESRCKVQNLVPSTNNGQVRMVTVGGVSRPVVEGGVHLPMDAAEMLNGWEWEVTAAGRGSDPLLVGKRYRVEKLAAKSFSTAHRYDVVEL